MDNPFFGFTGEEAIEALGMDKQIFSKHFKDLEELGIMEVYKRSRRIFYRINMQHPLVKGFYKIVTQISLKIAEKEMEKMKQPVKVRS